MIRLIAFLRRRRRAEGDRIVAALRAAAAATQPLTPDQAGRIRDAVLAHHRDTLAAHRSPQHPHADDTRQVQSERE